MEQNCTSEQILGLTLEIIYLLTGEDYAPINPKPSNPPNPSPRLEKNMDKKILEITKKIIDLLTGEVPVRCQDVTVYFSMDEWEYLEGHKDLYKDAILASQPALTSADGSSNGNPPDICPLPQNSTHELHKIPHHDPGENFEAFDEFETYVTGDQEPSGMVEISIEIPIDELNSSSDFYVEDEDITRGSPDENTHTSNTHHTSGNRSQEASNFEKPLSDTLTQPSHVPNKGKRVLRYQPGINSTQKAEPPKGHQKVHASKVSFECTECGKCFGYRCLLVNHQRVHTGERPFVCSICDKRFTQKVILDNHERTHTGEEPFDCHKCDKSFKSPAVLIAHDKNKHKKLEQRKPFLQKASTENHQREGPYLRSRRGKPMTEDHNAHAGEKPLTCSECGKHFSHKSTFTMHLRVHTGERPFKCPDCGKCFAQKVGLLIHQRTHTGERPFSCKDCGKKFVQKAGLLVHERIHTGEKPFRCSECGKKFTQQGHLAKHLKLHS